MRTAGNKENYNPEVALRLLGQGPLAGTRDYRTTTQSRVASDRSVHPSKPSTDAGDDLADPELDADIRNEDDDDDKGSDYEFCQRPVDEDPRPVIISDEEIEEEPVVKPLDEDEDEDANNDTGVVPSEGGEKAANPAKRGKKTDPNSAAKRPRGRPRKAAGGKAHEPKKTDTAKVTHYTPAETC